MPRAGDLRARPASSSCSSTRCSSCSPWTCGDPELLAVRGRLLIMPDLLNYWLTGQTGQRAHHRQHQPVARPAPADWATALLERLGIPTPCLPRDRPAGHGAWRPAARRGRRNRARGASRSSPRAATTPRRPWPPSRRGRRLGLPQFRHLVADGRRAPAAGGHERALALNFTNEGGVGGTIRLLKNITGLWLIQECRRAWAAGRARALAGTRS